eukprot:TRINITY_DN3104_c0_g2_i1.p1 TRINITY_DN3104_c0_g2~~TRINITY_DN3104_c0_g2_i1.p1  ORF type:complete len:235 (-),score=55.48 TRINITY_DN3104_c0_g2_i1:125-829(-)
MSSVNFDRPDGTPVPGLLYGSNKRFGVIVIQEWWGVNESIKSTAEYISERLGGAYCLIPDLYRGKIGIDKEEAHHLLTNLDWPGALKDIAASAAYLRSLGCGKIGTVGFCMGGALTLGAAVAGSVDAASCCYGYNAGLGDISTIKVPVQCNFGMLDKIAGFSDPATADKVEELLKSGNVPHEFHRYENADHAFLNFPTESNSKARDQMGFTSFNEEAAQQGWNNIVSFFEAKLQ